MFSISLSLQVKTANHVSGVQITLSSISSSPLAHSSTYYLIYNKYIRKLGLLYVIFSISINHWVAYWHGLIKAYNGKYNKYKWLCILYKRNIFLLAAFACRLIVSSFFLDSSNLKLIIPGSFFYNEVFRFLSLLPELFYKKETGTYMKKLQWPHTTRKQGDSDGRNRR